MRKSKGYYTIDNSDLYWYFVPKYKSDSYVKCKLTLMYKKGTMKGMVVEEKNYKLFWDKIEHWEKYDHTRGN